MSEFRTHLQDAAFHAHNLEMALQRAEREAPDKRTHQVARTMVPVARKLRRASKHWSMYGGKNA